MRGLRILFLSAAVAAPLVALAVDEPHVTEESCQACHFGHNAPGAALTKEEGNFNLCQSCHVNLGPRFGFPWSVGFEAVPGTAGNQHSWSASASSMGATPPNPSSADPGEAAMAGHLDAGKLKCSTCHDTHQADTVAAGGRGTQHVSPVTPPGGATGTLSVTSAPAGLAAKAYLVRITQNGNVGAARFSVSNDNGISWVQTGVTTAPTVTLGDEVVLAFGGTGFRANDDYRFHVSYPFLRADNTGAKMCLTCHKDRDQRAADVAGGMANGIGGGKLASVILGTTAFHHPVGQALANDYDRTGGANGAVLDTDGSAQGSGSDPNHTNDLAFGAGGIVTCLTCHHPHNADSNSLTQDAR